MTKARYVKPLLKPYNPKKEVQHFKHMYVFVGSPHPDPFFSSGAILHSSQIMSARLGIIYPIRPGDIFLNYHSGKLLALKKIKSSEYRDQKFKNGKPVKIRKTYWDLSTRDLTEQETKLVQPFVEKIERNLKYRTYSYCESDRKKEWREYRHRITSDETRATLSKARYKYLAKKRRRDNENENRESI